MLYRRKEIIEKYKWIPSKEFYDEHPEFFNNTISIWKKIWYPVCRWYEAFTYFFVRKYQKVRYGFELNESWNLNIYTAKFILPRLVYLRLNLHGYPPGLSEKEWDVILDKMIYSFEMILLDNEECLELPNKIWDKIQDGLDLFGKYYLNLWD